MSTSRGSARRITQGQLLAARKLLGLSRTDLAIRAGMSVPTLQRAEAGNLNKASEETIARLVALLEADGIEFTNADGPGVRLRKQN